MLLAFGDIAFEWVIALHDLILLHLIYKHKRVVSSGFFMFSLDGWILQILFRVWASWWQLVMIIFYNWLRLQSGNVMGCVHISVWPVGSCPEQGLDAMRNYPLQGGAHYGICIASFIGLRITHIQSHIVYGVDQCLIYKICVVKVRFLWKFLIGQRWQLRHCRVYSKRRSRGSR